MKAQFEEILKPYIEVNGGYNEVSSNKDVILEIMQATWNAAIDAAAEGAEVESYYPAYDEFADEHFKVNKQSILKLKK